jgi:hypothetical protein
VPSAKCQIAIALLALLAFGTIGCSGDIPESRVVVPRLQLGKIMLKGVKNTYGPARMETPDGLWYVGPGPQSLTHGNFGWMTRLSFDPAGYLCTQEFLDFGQEKDYLSVDYWISGRLDRRDRDADLDQMLIARSVILANSDRNYVITMHEPGLFVLARVLPGGNEPVVQCRVSGEGDRCEVSATVRVLPDRDEPLIDAMRGAIEKRMLRIEVVDDTNTPATEGMPAVTP